MAKTQFTWIECDMTSKDWEAIDKSLEDNDFSFDELENLLDKDNLKLSIGYLPDDGTFRATLLAGKGNTRYQDMGLSSFAQTLTEALVITIYKHAVKFKRGDWTVADKSKRG